MLNDVQAPAAEQNDGDLLRGFSQEGFTPGTGGEVEKRKPAAGTIRVTLAGRGERTIGEKAAEGLYVRPHAALAV